MEVIVAEKSGFCSGVKRAFWMAELLIKSGKAPVQTYGELVHNPDVVAFLEGKGVIVANSLDDVIKDAYVVVRAHGIPDSEMKRLKEKAANVYDGKCPTVGRLQAGLREKVGQGYFAVVLGKKGHPEMVCVTGDLPEQSYAVAGNLGEAMAAIKASHSLVYFCAQTTKNPVEFDEMAKALGVFCKGMDVGLEVKNTTCKPTGDAKRFAAELARQSDAMVVVGGANSENTQALVSVCEAVYRSSGRIVVPVVNGSGLAEYLKARHFNGVKKVGVTAGTSTPQWVIDDVCSRLRAYN